MNVRYNTQTAIFLILQEMSPTQKIIFRHKYQSTLFNDSYKIPELSVAGTNRSVIMAVSAPGDINNKCIIINVGSSVPQLPVYSGSKIQTNMLMLHYESILELLEVFGRPRIIWAHNTDAATFYMIHQLIEFKLALIIRLRCSSLGPPIISWCIITIIERNLLLMLMRYYFQLRSHFL